MENGFEMYSNEDFGKNLQTLIDDSGYSTTEIEKKLKDNWNIEFSHRQLDKYKSGKSNQIIRADKLYALACFFSVSIDALLGRCELDGFYYMENQPSINKFHLDSKSKCILSEMRNETQIDIINKIISSPNILDTFATQLENASKQIKSTEDIESKETITYVASCILQREIDKLFRKCLKEFLKK